MWQKIKDYYHLMRAILALLYFGYPAKKLKVIGVTGTDGKTTTAHFIADILKSAGKKVSYVSSIGAKIANLQIDTGFHVTTPDPWKVQELLRKMVDAGSEYVVLEVTSHGLDQNRVVGCNFLVGVLTNISHEHLDYHKTFENYLVAKAKLFRQTQISVLNVDDVSFDKIKRLASGKIVTYGIKNKADFTLKTFPLKLSIPGEFNLYNALAAAAVCKTVDVKDGVIRKALEEFRGLSGRMEEIDEGQDFKVFVDFAHTPNGLEQALKTLCPQLTVHSSRLISVFGSAGLRDIQKRELMGEISGKLADYTVITDEDPRTEDPKKITEAIAKGCARAGAREFTVSSSQFPVPGYIIVNNRGKAIRFAICELAKKGDIVGIFGKGHERSMCYGKTEYPWSDQDEARKALKEIVK